MDALLLVDIQNDFCPGGALAVPAGDAVVAVANALSGRFDLVVATQDYHPPNHGSFASRHPGKHPGDTVQLAGVAQILWPPHCVRGTPGASFHPDLDVTRIGHVVRKGTRSDVDSYSAFFDNARKHRTGLDDLLRGAGVTTVWLCGLATDYCVKFTALDARELGYTVRVVPEGCRAVDLRPGDGEAALADMAHAGVRIIPLHEVP